MRAAVTASGSWWYIASVPLRSRYHSSMLDGCTTGANRCSTAAISRLLRLQAPRGTGTQVASGQSCSARAIGMAERTPKARHSYDAEHTTPRLPGRPPTMRRGARPAPSGSTMRATATKNASASASRMRRAADMRSKIPAVEARPLA